MKLKSANTRNVSLYGRLHADNPEYGNSSQALVGAITYILKNSDIDFNPADRILDFGCGKYDAVVKVAKNLRITFEKYDPAIEKYAKAPVGDYRVVINTDVLEHIDEEELPTLLTDISSLTEYALFNISTRPAKTILANGENAHATVKRAEWWQKEIQKFFEHSCIVWKSNDQVLIATFEVSPKVMKNVALLRGGGIVAKLAKLML